MIAEVSLGSIRFLKDLMSSLKDLIGFLKDLIGFLKDFIGFLNDLIDFRRFKTFPQGFDRFP